MNQYLLLILLTSWSLVITHSEPCDTGVAFPHSILSLSRSSLANADVALLESTIAETVEKCMEDCCSGKFGDCTVVSYIKVESKKNCLLYNCRPLKQCKFLSSNTTDSFTFSKGPHSSHPVPSSQTYTTSTPTSSSATPTTSPKAKSHIEQSHAVEEIATYSDEQANLKNDNTSVKPRKGVSALTPNTIFTKSGIKARKGVTLEDVPHSKFLLKGFNKSNVKPRKGVELELSTNETFSYNHTSTKKDSDLQGVMDILVNSNNDTLDDELAFAKMFEDDTTAASTGSSNSPTTTFETYSISPTRSSQILVTTTEARASNFELESSLHPISVVSSSHLIEYSFLSTQSLAISSTILQSSIVTSTVAKTSSVSVTSTVTKTSSFAVPLASTVPLLSANTLFSMEEPKALEKSLDTDSTESENERIYKSSIHVVLALVFGLLVLFVVIGVVAKRVYESWQRRDYYRMNYLIDGVYNNYH